MKFPIAWHKDCLNNLQRSMAEAERTAQRAVQNFERIRAHALDYEAQIAEAEKRNMDGFDPERFLKNKRGQS